ncbi:MAG: hypothetical protein SWK76_03540 [Actinomycetota bacterium]|nr:hypothetical protein [Actinomycetota bacterium]
MAEGLYEPAALQGWEVPGKTRVSFNAGAYVQAMQLSTTVSSEGREIYCERSMYGNDRNLGPQLHRLRSLGTGVRPVNVP